MQPNPSGLIADRNLYLGSGSATMHARCTLYHQAADQFELYIQVCGEVPRRQVGKLGDMIDAGQRFIDARKAEGYLEAFEQFTPNPIN